MKDTLSSLSARSTWLQRVYHLCANAAQFTLVCYVNTATCRAFPPHATAQLHLFSFGFPLWNQYQYPFGYHRSLIGQKERSLYMGKNAFYSLATIIGNCKFVCFLDKKNCSSHCELMKTTRKDKRFIYCLFHWYMKKPENKVYCNLWSHFCLPERVKRKLFVLITTRFYRYLQENLHD